MRHGAKVAFAGAGGTGKTTTVNDLIATPNAGVEGFTVIPSASRTVYTQKTLTEDKVLAMSLEERWHLQHEIFNKKIELDDTTPQFIADRTLLDHWAYCLLYCAPVITPDEYLRTEAMVRKHMLSAYTDIFYFPWGCWTAPSDGVRQDNPAWQSAIDALILGYLHKWGVKYISVPQNRGRKARAVYVTNNIRGMRIEQ